MAIFGTIWNSSSSYIFAQWLGYWNAWQKTIESESLVGPIFCGEMFHPSFKLGKFYLLSGVEKLSTGCDIISMTTVVKLKCCWLKTCLIQNNTK